MSDAEQNMQASRLTDKGHFALELISQGINPTHDELDQLWKEANDRAQPTQPEAKPDEKLRDKIEEQVHEARLQPNEVFCEEFVNAIMELHTVYLQAAVQQARIEERRDMKLGFLRELANKPAPKGDDVHLEYTKGWVSMQGKIKFEIQRLQQLKRENLNG